MHRSHAIVLLAPVLLVSTSSCAAREYRLNALGGAGQGLSRLTSDKEHELGPSLSADGRTLLFDTRLGRNAAIIGVDPSSGARRTVFTTSSSRAQEAAWDTRGRFFVYTSNSSGAWSLVRSVTNSPNAAVSIIVSGELAPIVSDPDLSPDGQTVAFATRLRSGWNIATARLDGSNFTLMGEGVSPAWSPDGKRLAFVRATGDRAHIFTMDANTGTDIVQVTNGESDNYDPTWSPDGSMLVFSSNRSSKKPPRTYFPNSRQAEVRGGGYIFNLFGVRSDGTGVVQMTDGDASNIQPMWAQDGFIYFASNQAGTFDIWRLRPVGVLQAGMPR